jgi:hypothetical protein
VTFQDTNILEDLHLQGEKKMEAAWSFETPEYYSITTQKNMT